MRALKITGIQHHSVVVADLARAREFYGEVLGLEEVPPPPTFDSPVAWYAVGDGQIHLLLAEEGRAPSRRHVALQVDDLLAARQRLQQVGAPVSETTPIPGAERFFTQDPDGNRIELIHWSTPWEETVRALGLRLPGRPEEAPCQS